MESRDETPPEPVAQTAGALIGAYRDNLVRAAEGLARAMDLALRQARRDLMTAFGWAWVYEDGWAVKPTYRRGDGD